MSILGDLTPEQIESLSPDQFQILLSHIENRDKINDITNLKSFIKTLKELPTIRERGRHETIVNFHNINDIIIPIPFKGGPLEISEKYKNSIDFREFVKILLKYPQETFYLTCEYSENERTKYHNFSLHTCEDLKSFGIEGMNKLVVNSEIWNEFGLKLHTTIYEFLEEFPNIKLVCPLMLKYYKIFEKSGLKIVDPSMYSPTSI